HSCRCPAREGGGIGSIRPSPAARGCRRGGRAAPPAGAADSGAADHPFPSPPRALPILLSGNHVVTRLHSSCLPTREGGGIISILSIPSGRRGRKGGRAGRAGGGGEGGDGEHLFATPPRGVTRLLSSNHIVARLHSSCLP